MRRREFHAKAVTEGAAWLKELHATWQALLGILLVAGIAVPAALKSVPAWVSLIVVAAVAVAAYCEGAFRVCRAAAARIAPAPPVSGGIGGNVTVQNVEHMTVVATSDPTSTAVEGPTPGAPSLDDPGTDRVEQGDEA